MINEREQCKNTKKVSFITLGCKVNQYDSDAMRTLFIHRGYKPVEHSEVADVYIINTCSVTSIGDRKSRQVIRKIRRNNPDAVIAATGCYAQVAPEELEKMGDVDVIVGHQNRNKIVDYIEEAEKSEKTVNAVKDIMSIREYENLTVDPEGEVKARAFVKVQEGCDNYCTFCIIPYARGRLKSRKQEDAVDEIKKLVEKGYREVVLTGIHLGNYGRDLRNGTSLSTLVSELLKIPNLLRIRLGSIESVELSDELINIIKNEKRVCHHLHLPLQSGSDAVLKSMNRHYRLRQYKDLIAMLRKKIPNLALTTDLIVGFPGETEENFKETLNTLHELKFSAIHVFPFSKRTGTPAAMYPNQITNEEKKKRVHRVQELEKKISKEFKCEFLNKIVHVLAENKKEEYFEGFSDEYIRVTIKGENVKRGHLYSVIVEEVTDEGLIGRVIEEV